MRDVVQNISLKPCISTGHIDPGHRSLVVGVGPQADDLALSALDIGSGAAVACRIDQMCIRDR